MSYDEEMRQMDEERIRLQDGLPFVDLPEDEREDDEVFLSYLLGEE
jgi:hypothetical protein